MLEKNKYFIEKVKPIEVSNPKKISQLLSEMSQTGFQGRKLGEVVDAWEEMIRDKNVTIFMGYAGSLSTTGQWKIINWLIENRFIDVLVSTGANISEDIVDAMGYSYWKGDHRIDDLQLRKHYINRYYDVFGSDRDYRKMGLLIKEFMETLDSNKIYSSMDFTHLLGKWLWKKGIRSIVATAAKNNVPVICPAIVDSEYGFAAYYAREKGFKPIIDQFKDFEDAKKITDKGGDTGVIYIGGGVPKDFIQLLAYIRSLVNYDSDEVWPHKYAIQITTDTPQWGGLSGCTFEEAVSWGKELPDGKNVVCYCDATIALPLVTHALAERVKFKRNATDFSWMFKSI